METCWKPGTKYKNGTVQMQNGDKRGAQGRQAEETVPAPLRRGWHLRISMQTPEFFRKQRMWVQLGFTFGFIVVLMFGVFMGLWAAAVVGLRDSIIRESRSNLREQVAEVGRRISQEAKEVFETKISVGTKSFLTPISIAMFDAHLDPGYSLQPLPLYTAENLDSLRQPLHEPSLLGAEDRFQCNQDECVAWRDGYSSGGCDCMTGWKRISLLASSVFQTGMDGNSDPLPRLSNQMDQIEKSSYIDAFIRDVWASNENWIQVYVGIPAGSQGASLFRSYPGTVREGLTDPDNLSRYYDPVERPWYNDALGAPKPDSDPPRDRSTQLEAPKVIVTAPYEDADGKGVLISVASAIYGAGGELLGVAGLDLFVSSLRDFIESIQARESGEAFLFHVRSDYVLASRQLLATQQDLPYLRDLALVSEHRQRFSDIGEYPCSTEESSTIEHGVMLLWAPVFDREFCLVVATLIDEIDEPIESQLQDIKDGASEMIQIPLLLCLICGGAMILVVLLIAVELSRPLRKSAFESGRIAQSIGRTDVDLRAPEESPGMLQQCYQKVLGNVGEVANLRSRFRVLLDDLIAKRQTSKPEKNPLYNHVDAFRGVEGWNGGQGDEQQAAQLAELAMVGGASDEEARVEVKSSFSDQKTLWNRLQMQLILKVILPLVVCIIVIVTLSGVRMNSRATDWARPVQQQMIQEEFQSVDQRVAVRAVFVSEFLTRERNALTTVKQYWRNLTQADFTFAAGSAPSAFLQPHSQCERYLRDLEGIREVPANPPLVVDNVCRGASRQPETLAQDASSNYQLAQREISVEGVHIFVPMYPLENDPANDNVEVTKQPAGAEGFDFGSVAQEAEVMAHMTNAMRASFFSTVPDHVYIGTHKNEVMWLFPGVPMEGYTNPDGPRFCDSVREPTWDSKYRGRRTSQYNPTCRPWYQRAVLAEEQGAMVFNPIDFAAGSAEPVPYMALSTALWVDQQLVGVASVDVRLGQLSELLNSTPLYEQGYAFIWDEQGLAVVHKGIKPGLADMSIRWVDATSGGDYPLDEEWFREQEKGIFAKGRVTGNWTFEWHNKAANRKEVWHYTFTPIEGTPYMLALSVFQPDVTAQADAMLDSLKGKVSRAAGITAAFVAVGCLLLAGLVYWFNRELATPIDGLADYLGEVQSDGYRSDLPLGESAKSSREMGDIIENMRKMLVALRFCNKEYTGGDPRREMDSCCVALELVAETENKPGEGICYNNMGNAALALEARQLAYERTVAGPEGTVQVTASPGEAAGWFQKAIKSAQEQSDGAGDKTELVATRKLNLALYQVSLGNEAAGRQHFGEAFGATDSPAALARMAFGGLRAYVDRVAAPWVYAALGEGAERALGLMAGKHDNTPGSIAEACAVMAYRDYQQGEAGRGGRRAWWALGSLDTMPTPCFKVLLFVAMVGAPEAVMDLGERTMRERQAGGRVNFTHVVQCARQRKAKPLRAAGEDAGGGEGGGGGGGKSVIFTIDISGSMQIKAPMSEASAPPEPSTLFILQEPKASGVQQQRPPGSRLGIPPERMRRLDVCKESLLQVVERVITPQDWLGLYVFDNLFEPRLELQAFKVGTMRVVEKTVQAIETRGGTAFWDAVRKSMELQQQNSVREDKWIIALTDGEDQHSDSSSYPWIIHNIKFIKVNLVVITVACQSAADRIRMIKEEAAEGGLGNEVLHIEAKNEEIAEAFGRVEAMLAPGGLSENL